MNTPVATRKGLPEEGASGIGKWDVWLIGSSLSRSGFERGVTASRGMRGRSSDTLGMRRPKCAAFSPVMDYGISFSLDLLGWLVPEL